MNRRARNGVSLRPQRRHPFTVVRSSQAHRTGNAVVAPGSLDQETTQVLDLDASHDRVPRLVHATTSGHRLDGNGGRVRSAGDRSHADAELICRDAERTVVVDVGQADGRSEVACRCQRLQRHQVQPSARVQQLGHRPGQGSQRNQVHLVGERADRTHHVSRQTRIGTTETTTTAIRRPRVRQGPAQAVVPEAGRRQPVCSTKETRLVAEQHVEEQVVVDQEPTAHSRSGSVVATRAASQA